MRSLSWLIVILGLGLFSVGCSGGSTEPADDNTEIEDPEVESGEPADAPADDTSAPADDPAPE